MKYYRMSYEEILHRRSYKNLMLLNASIPSLYDAENENGEGRKKKEVKHANQIFDSIL